ncbi:MAG: hypothetical protein GY869_22860, partial [Planctomycetes bacterium]|nr:hypothetical protein [Planctomycetota bacterium]
NQFISFPDFTFTIFSITGLTNWEHLSYLKIIDQYQSALSLPLEQHLTAVNNIETHINNMSNLHVLIPELINDISAAFSIHLRTNAQLQNAHTALAIEQYRLDHDNQIPDTLTDLIPDYLETIPLDPYDTQPIKYQKTNPGYLIYSVGPNLTDDHGINISPSTGDILDITFTVNR